MITKNVGNMDRAVRMIAALGLGYAAYRSAGVIAIILGAVALAVLGTALAGWCWLYTLLGVSTSKTEKP